MLFGLGMAAAVAGGRLVLFFQMGSFFPGTVSSPANSSSSLTLDLCAGVRPSFACANFAFLVSSVLNRRSTRLIFFICLTGSSSEAEEFFFLDFDFAGCGGGAWSCASISLVSTDMPSPSAAVLSLTKVAASRTSSLPVYMNLTMGATASGENSSGKSTMPSSDRFCRSMK